MAALARPQPIQPPAAPPAATPAAHPSSSAVPDDSSDAAAGRRSWKGKARADEGQLADAGVGEVKLLRRAVATGPVAEGYPDCSRVGNDQLTCYPLSNTSVAQNDWSKLIWNSNFPGFIAADNSVDVHLFLASSDALIESWTALPNEESQLAFQPTDRWWVDEYGASSLSSGGNQTWEAYFVVVPGGQSLAGTESHQPTFAAVQTALPTTASLSLASVSSTRSLSSAASAQAAISSSSTLAAASASSASARASLSSLSERIKTDPVASSSVAANGGIGSLQGDSGSGDGLPKYAIALLSVLGALLLITILALTYLFLRRLHKRRMEEADGGGAGGGYYGHSSSPSFGSGRPIIDSAAAAAAGGAGALAGAGVAGRERARGSSDPHSPTSPYGTATDDSHSLQQHVGGVGGGPAGGRMLSPSPHMAFVPGPRSVSSSSHQPGGGGQPSIRPHPSFATSPLSETDAASISAAYRSALSHPEFNAPALPLDLADEGDSPPTDEDDGGERMRRELEREGIGLRGVPGGRGGQTVD